MVRSAARAALCRLRRGPILKSRESERAPLRWSSGRATRRPLRCGCGRPATWPAARSRSDRSAYSSATRVTLSGTAPLPQPCRSSRRIA